MGTAKQLIPTFVDAQPLYWDRSYAKNMRPLRAHPNYYRIEDSFDYIDGPPQEGQQYNKENIVWKCEIILDEDFDKTNQIRVYNLKDTITETSEVLPNGQTQYYYKYNSTVPEFILTHTDIIDAVSVEFDQSGNRIIAFESLGNIYLNYFDSVSQGVITRLIGPGRTPVVCTSTYKRVGAASESERYLFYVDAVTEQIVALKGIERYTIEYALPSASSRITELLQVSKNIYGELLVVASREIDSDTVDIIAFTEQEETVPDAFLLNSDVYLENPVFSEVTELNINIFNIAIALINISFIETTEPSTDYLAKVDSLLINNFNILSKIVNYILPFVDSDGTSSVDSLSINDFSIASKLTEYVFTNIDSAGIVEVDSLVLNIFSIEEKLINYSFIDIEFAGNSSVDTLTINTFTIA